ncbi:hypothetical protein Dda_3033 [Drechslerella dactyloides]|uniref:F-box domain-containing protein n=1 Tax=Drechslerella dactyloides TaxID=74499 RepID=A0AAD6J0K6_DREDA|nr:hypothetical protein Dda_3033 [Drechslerella dactyloides]
MAPGTRRQASGKPSSSAVVKYSTPRQAKYPRWTELPYYILVDIFRYAATIPPNNGSSLDHAWILGLAVTCKAFHEPAIDLLYTAPATNMVAIRRLLETISQNPALGGKVRELESPFTYIVEPKISKFKLDQLLEYTPNIRHINIGGGFKRENASVPRTFPKQTDNRLPEVLATMEEKNISLRSWTWDRGFCKPLAAKFDPLPTPPKGKAARRNCNFRWLDIAHSDLAAFKRLRELTMTGFTCVCSLEPGSCDQVFHKQKGFEDRLLLESVTIAGAIGKLKYLTDLNFQDCNFITGDFMNLIADMQLRRLSIDGSNSCSTDALRAFLLAGGKNLQELEIIHCPNVRLDFLSVLEMATPNLKSLVFEDVPGSVDDEDLEVMESPMPQWPATLQSILMRSLGNWTPVNCEVFLRSLVDAAREGSFTSLREIDVWCILPKLGWRDRAESRKRWGDEFMIAFQDRRSEAWKAFVRKKKSEGEAIKKGDFAVPAFCQKVLYRLDDSRPTGNQLREEDFLDALGESRKPPKKKSKAKAKDTASASTSKKTLPKNGTSSEQKKKRKSDSHSFVVGRKRPRYNSEDDEDFEADQLAYEDEDGDDSSWSNNEEYD